ncbi:hypothetical protein [Sphingobium aquiterrae]|uniref:hypothetical protein n=1 Tax=Sphingobium aquiterrae TaxID=2038656 RepID=UPI0030189A7D
MSITISLRARIALCAVVVAALALHGLAYWPGIMTYDSVRQYDQALSGAFDDWHPPVMGWIWRQLHVLMSGPAPMLLLQLLLYWSGFALIAGWAWRQRRRTLACALLLAGLLPIPLAIMGTILKDCLMTGALLWATAAVALARPGRDRALRLAAAGLVCFAAMLRFNAFLAGLPLLVALMPAGWVAGWPRRVLAIGGAGLLLVACLPVANRLIGAEPTDVALSQMIFDMGGITEYSGVDVFPTLPVRNPVAVNHHCYTPVKWDSYSWWVDQPCPIGFELVRQTFKAHHRSPFMAWLGAILTHPLAYAEHRLHHFNINSRFLIHDEVERPVQDQSAPNPWGYRVPPNGARAMIDSAALAMAHTPLGWPILWLAAALGVLAIARSLPSRGVLVPLTLSVLFYGFGYLWMSVAAEMRYHLWTIVGTAIALLIAASDLGHGARPGRGTMLIAFTPAILVALLCSLWRVVPGL